MRSFSSTHFFGGGDGLGGGGGGGGDAGLGGCCIRFGILSFLNFDCLFPRTLVYLVINRKTDKRSLVSYIAKRIKEVLMPIQRFLVHNQIALYPAPEKFQLLL